MLETGEPREVHHFSLLIGYGCGAINPYLAFETLDDMIRQGLLTDIDHKTACKNYVKAAIKGVVKVISKMGISTIQSYRGAQIFEADRPEAGRHRQIFHLDAFARRRRRPRRDRAGSAACGISTPFPTARSTATRSMSAASINGAQKASITCSIRRRFTSCSTPCRTGNYKTFKEYSALVNDQIEAAAARCAACWISRPATAGSDRRSRAGRERS